MSELLKIKDLTLFYFWKAYREFVEERAAIGTSSPFDALVDVFLLGGEEFISMIKERSKGHHPDRDK